MQELKLFCIIFFVFVVVLLMLIFPFSTKIKFHIDLITLQSSYVIKILGIKLLCGKAYIQDNKLHIQNTHNAIIKQDKEEQKKEGLFLRQIIKNIHVQKLEIYFDFGLPNAYISSIVCGYAQIIFAALCSFVTTTSKYSHIKEGVMAHYKQERCELLSQLAIGISLAKIIKSKIIANKQHKENSRG